LELPRHKTQQTCRDKTLVYKGFTDHKPGHKLYKPRYTNRFVTEPTILNNFEISRRFLKSKFGAE
jgi:hypothetical protein